MALPVEQPISEVAQEMYDSSMRPLAYADEQHDWALLHLTEACAGLLQVIRDLGFPQNGNPGWSQVLDIDVCPGIALPWLAQFVGINPLPVFPASSSEQAYDLQRDYIRSAPGLRRGTPGAIIAEILPLLTGTKTIIFRERPGGFAYRLEIRVYFSETPPEEWASTNLITNGGFETNVTGWNTVNGTITRHTDTSMFGIASGIVVNTASNTTHAYHDATISGATLGRRYTASIYVKGDENVAGRVCNILLEEWGGAQPPDGEAEIIVLTGDWQRISVTKTIEQNDRTSLRLMIEDNVGISVPGNAFFVDGAQIEEMPLASPYIETDGSTASRPQGPDSVLAAIMRQKPAGILLDYDSVLGQDYQQLYENHTDYQDVFTTYTDYQEVVLAQP